jgi:hypothetical protein
MQNNMHNVLQNMQKYSKRDGGAARLNILHIAHIFHIAHIAHILHITNMSVIDKRV